MTLQVPNWIKIQDSCIWCNRLSNISDVNVNSLTEDIYVTYSCSSDECEYYLRNKVFYNQTVIYGGHRLQFYKDFLDEKEKYNVQL